MSKIKPSIPKGMRDFGPKEVFKRQYIINHIKHTFEKFGFLPLETPTMENLNTLTGKYGDEGDQLLFKVLDSGDFLKKPKKTIINEEQFAFINLHLYEVFHDLFKHFAKSDSWESISEYVRKKNYNIISSTSAYIYDKEILNTIDEYIISIKDVIQENISIIKSRLRTDKGNFDFYFKQFFKSHFLNKDNTTLYSDLLKILRSKNYNLLGEITPKELATQIAEKGLRYDLTIPFARYVVMNQNDIAFPFKRYQIQPVWRADRPQKGRYREFYQCDADVIGTDSLLPEAEIIMMIQEVFGKLGIEDYTIKINNRKVLQGIIEKCNASEKFQDVVIAIDKLDKIGIDGVKKELESKNLSSEQISSLFNYLNLDDNPSFDNINERLNFYQVALNDNEIGMKGVKELLDVHGFLIKTNTNRTKVKFDATLARGLNYYTGCIFEVVVNNVQIGSVSGGGRYDDLTSGFGLPNVSGVGFSFGLDRIFDVMTELNLFPEEVITSTQVIIIPFDENSFNYSLSALQKLRDANIKSELYPDLVKMKKSMKYANDKNIPYVILIGSNEIETGKLSFKNMETGEQQNLTIEEIINQLN